MHWKIVFQEHSAIVVKLWNLALAMDLGIGYKIPSAEAGKWIHIVMNFYIEFKGLKTHDSFYSSPVISNKSYGP